MPQPVRAIISSMENGRCRDNNSQENSDGESSDNCREMITGRPPRPVAAIRHCASTARLAGPSESELVRVFLAYFVQVFLSHVVPNLCVVDSCVFLVLTGGPI